MNEHLDEDILERYILNALPEAEAESVEDHISLCIDCLDRLDGITAFVNAIRRVLQMEDPRQQKAGSG